MMPDVNGFLTPEERQAMAQERLAQFAQMAFFGFGKDAFRAGLRAGLAKGQRTTDCIATGLDNCFRELKRRTK